MGISGRQEIFDESVSAVTLTPSNTIGTTRYEGENKYLYVFNAGGEQISPGLGVTISAVTGYSVTVSSVTSVNPCIGVVENATLTTDTFGWVVTRGFVSIEMTAQTGIAASEPIILGTNGVHARATGATGYAFAPHGFGVGTIGSGASGVAYVNCFS